MINTPAISKKKILTMNSKQLQEQIILTLEKRPAQSVKKANLPSEVLKNIGMDIRRTARKKFEKKVFRTVESLINYRIVKEYKAKNIRIKLQKEYKNRLFTVSEEPKAIFQQGDIDLIQEEEYETINSDLIEKEIPDLPDNNFKEAELIPSESETIADEATSPSEKERLLDIFLGEDKYKKQEDYEGRSDSYDIQKTSLLQNLKKIYDKNDRIDSSASFSELRLKVNTDSGYIIVVINLHEVRKEIIIKSFIPYLEEATLDILKLFSRVDFMGSLCLEDVKSQLFFSIRISVDLAKFLHEEIVSLVDQIIAESCKIEEIIDSYL